MVKLSLLMLFIYQLHNYRPGSGFHTEPRGRSTEAVVVPRSMLFDLRVLMISSWEASPNCLVRFSDMLWRPNPSLWKAASESFSSGLRELHRGLQIREA